MARVKNVTINDNEFIKLPVTDSNNRSSTGLSEASFKYNSTTQNTEFYTAGGSWSSTTEGANLRQGLVLDLDADYYAEKNRREPMLSHHTWRNGGTDATNFGRNGGSNENSIFMGTDPFGNSALIWGSFPDGSGGADGGWNSSFFSTDPRKTYRSMVWVRRTSGTSSGTFYHGTNGGGSAVIRLDNGSANSNPYWVCDGTGSLTQNEWRLHVSHILPYNYTRGNVRHPETGVYTLDGNRIGFPSGCNVGVDMRNAPGTTSLRQRVYHYYCGDSTTRLQWWQPRLELLDGNEPSIEDVLTNKLNEWGSPNAYLVNYPVYNATERALTFEPSGCKHIKLAASFGYSTQLTVAAWIKTKGSGDGGYHIVCGPSDCEISIPNGTGAARVGLTTSDGRFVSDHGSNLNDGAWHHVAMTFDGSTKTAYIDGVSQGTQTVTGTLTTYVGSRAIGTFGQGDTSYGMNGYIAQFQLYTRGLSAAEMKALFENQRSRYGV
jgi:hypothetical protein